MFNTIGLTTRLETAKRLLSLFVSVAMHAIVLVALIVIPLVFFSVLPDLGLLTFLIAAPEPPVPPPPPPPPGILASVTHRPVLVEHGEFTEPPGIPNGIPDPGTDQPPIVDLSLFRNRNFALGTVAFCFGYAVFFANNLLMPLWLQTQIGYTATWAGLVAAPTGAIAVLLTPLTARMMSRVDARIIATVAFVAFGVSYLMRAGLTADASFFAFMLPLLVQGVAMATFFLAMITILLDGVPPPRIPLASGLSNFARITAGGFAASIVTTLWDRREALHQSRMADLTTAFSPTFNQVLAGLHRLGLPDLGAKAALVRIMTGQAYLLGADDIFWVSGWSCFILIGMVWLCRKAKSGGGAPVAAD